MSARYDLFRMELMVCLLLSLFGLGFSIRHDLSSKVLGVQEETDGQSLQLAWMSSDVATNVCLHPELVSPTEFQFDILALFPHSTGGVLVGRVDCGITRSPFFMSSAGVPSQCLCLTVHCTFTVPRSVCDRKFVVGSTLPGTNAELLLY